MDAAVVNELSEGDGRLRNFAGRTEKHWFLLVSSSSFQNEHMSNFSANVSAVN